MTQITIDPELQRAWSTLQAVPSYCERTLPPFFEGERIRWHYSTQFIPATAVFICMRGDRAGIAVGHSDGSWQPQEVEVQYISARFE